MILLIEPDLLIRKQLCDLLPRERIIGIGTMPQTLEMLCRFQKRLKLMIVNVHLLREMTARQTMFKLCERLCIVPPPGLCVYQKADTKVKGELEAGPHSYRFILYDEKDKEFPDRYVMAAREIYPEIIADLPSARDAWARKDAPPSLIDPRKWLEEAGFAEVAEKIDLAEKEKKVINLIPIIERNFIKAGVEPSSVQDYKKDYYELKGKYDTLLEYVKELIDSVKK